MLHRLLGRINALQAPLINRIHQVTLISLVVYNLPKILGNFRWGVNG